MHVMKRIQCEVDDEVHRRLAHQAVDAGLSLRGHAAAVLSAAVAGEGGQTGSSRPIAEVSRPADRGAPSRRESQAASVLGAGKPADPIRRVVEDAARPLERAEVTPNFKKGTS